MESAETVQRLQAGLRPPGIVPHSSEKHRQVNRELQAGSELGPTDCDRGISEPSQESDLSVCALSPDLHTNQETAHIWGEKILILPLWVHRPYRPVNGRNTAGPCTIPHPHYSPHSWLCCLGHRLGSVLEAETMGFPTTIRACPSLNKGAGGTWLTLANPKSGTSGPCCPSSQARAQALRSDGHVQILFPQHWGAVGSKRDASLELQCLCGQ